MRTTACLLTASIALALLPGSAISYDRGEFLNFAIFTLPEDSFAGIPLENRAALFQNLSSQPKAKGIDYENGFFFHEKKAEADEKAEVNELSSFLWLRLLPRGSDSPHVYLHVATPKDPKAYPDEATYDYLTKVFRWRRESWEDVTAATIPESVDLHSHLPPKRKVPGAEILPKGYGVRFRIATEILVWENRKLHRRDAFPFPDSIAWEAPLDAERLSILIFRPREDYGDSRALAELIAHAAVTKDERFRIILEMEELRDSPVLTYALAAYDYALNRNEEAIDFMVKEVAREGNGDTDSKWMLCYFDEWDRTLEVYREYDGRDGAAAEASAMFGSQRKYFFPENFEKFWEKKHEEMRTQ